MLCIFPAPLPPNCPPISTSSTKWYFFSNWWTYTTAAAAKSLQSCPTLCDPIDGSPPGSSVPGILQARILEWAAISFSNAWKWKVKVTSLSRVRLFTTPWTAAHQAPPPMGVSRQEDWSGVPSPSPELTLTHRNYPKTTVYMGLIPGAVHSMAFSKCIMTCNDIMIYPSVWYIFFLTALKPSVFCVFTAPPNPTQILSIYKSV